MNDIKARVTALTNDVLKLLKDTKGNYNTNEVVYALLVVIYSAASSKEDLDIIDRGVQERIPSVKKAVMFSFGASNDTQFN